MRRAALMFLALASVVLGQKILTWTTPKLSYGSSTHATTMRGLIGYWPLDEGVTGKPSVVDASGSGRPGTWGAASASGTVGYYSPGKVGSWAGTFTNNNTSQVVIANYAGLPAGSATCTVAGWVFPTYISGSRNIFSYGAESSNHWRAVIMTNGTLFFSGYSNDVSSSLMAPINTWSFLAVTVNGATVTFCLNAACQSTSLPNGALNTVASAASIGLENYTGINPFVGLIDDVRIYNRALSAQEVQAIYLATGPNALQVAIPWFPELDARWALGMPVAMSGGWRHV